MKLALLPIVGQLKAGGCANAKGLLEFSAQKDVPARLPVYFVVPVSDAAQPNALAGARDQAVDALFDIMIVIEAARRHADGVGEDLKIETDRVSDALVGWTHPEASRPFDYRGGRLASADGSAVVWAFRVSTRHHIRKAN